MPVPVLKLGKIIDNRYRVICKLGTTLREMRDWLAENHGIYRQRIILEKEFIQFGKTVYDVKLIGGIPCQHQ